MLEIFELYKITIPAGAFFAASLGILGTQLAARERVMQTFCISQSALLGVLLGLGLLSLREHDHPEIHGLPLFLSLIMSALVFAFSEWVAKKVQTSQNTFFASIFALLLCLVYLLSSVFPALESHMASMFFGDLATLSEVDSIISLIIGISALLFLVIRFKKISSRSFDIAIYGEKSLSEDTKQDIIFLCIGLFLICFSVQFLGFLFTMSALFIPTSILTMQKKNNLKKHMLWVALIGFFSSSIGFSLTLVYSKLPTTPMIGICLVIFSVLALFIPGKKYKVKRDRVL